MRFWALVLVVLFTTSPLAEALAVTAPEPCPMAAAMPDGTSCLTAPCPCDHSAPAAVASHVTPTVLPGAAVSLLPAAETRPCLAVAAPLPAAGFPFAIDHPPDLGL